MLKKYGEYLEWKPDESKIKNGTGDAGPSSSKYGTTGGIEFHASKGNGNHMSLRFHIKLE